MAIHNDFGRKAEDKAEEYLKGLNYKILERNWRHLKAEIDIIAQKDSEIVIVEVKARSNDEILSPEEAVTLSKKKLLLMAADYYITSNDFDFEVRFDIISLLKKKEQWEINHIEDAFNALL